MVRERLWLCVAPATLCALDATVTLVGQPTTYWAGSYDTALELAPIFNFLLRTHPVAFMAGIATWMASFIFTLFAAPRRLALVFSVCAVLGHTFGAATWLADEVSGGIWMLFGLYWGGAVLLVLTWEQAGVIRPVTDQVDKNGTSVR